MAKNLIIYYSRKGQNYVNGSIKDLKKGNSEICAEFIQDSVGGDLFEIKPVNDYSEDYQTCTKEAAKELKNHACFLPGVVSRKKQVIPMLTALWG